MSDDQQQPTPTDEDDDEIIELGPREWVGYQLRRGWKGIVVGVLALVLALGILTGFGLWAIERDDEIAALQDELDEAVSELDTLEAESDELNGTVESLESEIRDVKDATEDSKGKVKKLRTEKAELTAEQTALQAIIEAGSISPDDARAAQQ